MPHLFYFAELDASRAGRAGMQIGSIRETIIVSLLIYRFGKQNVKYIPSTTRTEIDVILHNQPISIKTITATKIGSGIKAIWTVDAQKVREFVPKYKPICDMIVKITLPLLFRPYYINITSR